MLRRREIACKNSPFLASPFSSCIGSKADRDRFNTFFSFIDNFKSDIFLYLTSGGLSAAPARIGNGKSPKAPSDLQLQVQLSSEDEEINEEGG
jgi:hypothetical protein